MYDLRQKEKTVTEYYTKIKSLWDEIDSMRAAPPLTENNAEISTYVRVMQQEREEDKSEEALTFSRLWRFLSSSVSFSSFDSAMAKKKKASTPLPQTLTSSNETLVNNTLQNSKNTGAVSNPSTIVEDEELVTPGPSIVHPSVGAIPRTDAEIIASFNRLSFGNLRENTNGTVTRDPPVT